MRQRSVIFVTVAVTLGIFFTAVVFNHFHAATHSSAKFDLTNPFRKYLVIHVKCTMENHNDLKVTYDITTLNKDSFIKLMHMEASVRDPCHKQITPQHN